MDQLITFLSSGAIVALITAFFTYIQNRKSNSINYITSERKLWRDKIKTLAEDIQKCRYHGENDEDIQIYLVRLQMNINTYGRLAKNDYIHDSHIWEIMDKLQTAASEEEFESDKKLLLYYISFMLKEDWERSKREIRGYSYKIRSAVAYIVITIIWAVCYFFLLCIHDIGLFLCGEIYLLLPLLPVIYTDNETDGIAGSSRIEPVKNRIKKKRSASRGIWVLSIGLFFYMSFLFFFTSAVIPKVFISNFRYSYDSNTINICTNVNNNYFYGLEEILESCFEQEVVFVETYDETCQRYELPEEIYNEVYDKVKWNLEIFFILQYFILIGAVAPSFYHLWMIIKRNSEKRKLPDAIEKFTYSFAGCYDKDLLEVRKIALNVKELGNEELSNQDRKALFGLEYELLSRMKRHISSKLRDEERSIGTFEEYEQYAEWKRRKEIIDGCMKDLRKLSRYGKIDKKRKLLDRVSLQLEELFYNEKKEVSKKIEKGKKVKILK